MGGSRRLARAGDDATRPVSGDTMAPRMSEDQPWTDAQAEETSVTWRMRRLLARPLFRYLRPGGLWDTAPRPREWLRLGEYLAGLRAWSSLYEDRYTQVASRRGRALHRLADEVRRRGVPGDLVDCGCWKGGTTALLAAGAPDREVWAFDAFQPGDPDDEGRATWVGTAYEVPSPRHVQEAVGRFADVNRLHVVECWFRETFPEALPEISSVAIVHIDTEFYEPTRLSLEAFSPLVSPGGFVALNSYGDYAEVRAATLDFRQEAGVASRLLRTDHTGVYWRA
jgi:O-methyltransferase